MDHLAKPAPSLDASVQEQWNVYASAVIGEGLIGTLAAVVNGVQKNSDPTASAWPFWASLAAGASIGVLTHYAVRSVQNYRLREAREASEIRELENLGYLTPGYSQSSRGESDRA